MHLQLPYGCPYPWLGPEALTTVTPWYLSLVSYFATCITKVGHQMHCLHTGLLARIHNWIEVLAIFQNLLAM
eukprot:scaffold89_cov318-Pavlova_lutheri.AAC.17